MFGTPIHERVDALEARFDTLQNNVAYSDQIGLLARALAEQKANTTGLFFKIADMFEARDTRFQEVEGRVAALAEYVGARFTTLPAEPARPEKIVAVPMDEGGPF